MSGQVPLSLNFELIPDEILIKICLQSLKGQACPYKKVYFNGSLINKRFYQLFSDPLILNKIYKQYPIPFSFLLKKLSRAPGSTLLKKEIYNKIFTDMLYKSGSVNEAIDCLIPLSLSERGLITEMTFTNKLNSPCAPAGGKEIIHCGTKKLTQALKSYFSLLPNLHSITLSSLPAHSECLFETFSSYASQIFSLDIATNLSNPTYLKFAVCLPNLHSLSIRHGIYLTDLTLKQMFSTLTHLTDLNLSNAPLIHLERLTLPKTLYSLRLSGTNFTGQSTAFLLQNHQHLRALSIANTENCEESIQAILTSQIPFSELDFSHLDLSDEAFSEISGVIKSSLTSLELYGCCGISSKGIHTILTTFSKLKYLDVRNTSGQKIPPLMNREVKVLM